MAVSVFSLLGGYYWNKLMLLYESGDPLRSHPMAPNWPSRSSTPSTGTHLKTQHWE